MTYDVDMDGGQLPPTAPSRATLGRLATGAGLAAAALGPVTIAGWCTGDLALTAVLPGLVPMNPLTAICLTASGIALALLARHPHEDAPAPAPTPRRVTLARALALLVLAVGVVRLAGDVAGIGIGIDQLLFRDALARVPHAPNRMAPNTATGFVSIALALLLADVETRKGHRPSQLLALAAGLMSLLAMTGYAYGEPRLTAVRTFLPMALNTAAGFALLAAGLLWLRADRGFMRVVSSPYAGGATVRRLLPAAVLIPWGLGWLQLAGERLGLLGHVSGLALATVATMLVLAAVVWWTGRSVEAAEAAHRRAQEAVAASEARLRAILDNTTALVSMKDRDGRYVFVNRRFAEVVGRDRDALIGRTDADVFPAPLAERYASHDRAVLETGAPTEFEEIVPHGREPHTYVAVKFPLAAGAAHPWALCSIATDITARKRMEETLAERTRALEVANADLEAFNYSVSHDLRAPLRAIDGFARVLVEDHGGRLDEDAARTLARITDGARRMRRLIDGLLKFARCGRQGIDRAPVDMTALVESVGRELRQLDRGREVTFTVLPLPPAVADAGMLRQVLTNLLENAWKFTAGHADAAITVGARIADCGEVVYWVEDNGAGFDPSHAGKLFGVFQRLHGAEEFPGTGIGLAIVRRIVERHGGRVWGVGRPGAGATFCFTVPPPATDAPTLSA